MKPFRPIAYFDKHLDLAIVLFADCSFSEKPLNKRYSLLVENHAANKKLVGFTIGGVRHFLISRRRTIPDKKVAAIIRLMDSEPENLPAAAKEAIRRLLDVHALEIDLPL